MFRRPAGLLQLEAFPDPSLRSSATRVISSFQAPGVGFWSPTPAGVLKLVAQWDGSDGGSENRILGFKVTPTSTWSRTAPSSRRKVHRDLMQRLRAAQGSEHSTLVPMVAQTSVLARSLEQKVAKKSPQLQSYLPSQFQSPTDRRKSPDALLSAGAPCGKWIIAKGCLSGGALPRVGNMQFPSGHSLCAPKQH